MTYPPSNPGYPPQSGSQFDATQQFAKAVPAPAAPPAAPAASEPGENKLPEILLGVVAVTGLLIYFVSFAFEIQAVIGSLIIAVPLLAGLLAGVSVLPKQKSRVAPAAVLSTLGLLLAITLSVAAGSDADWTIWVLLVLTLVQAGAGIAALLFDAGILTPPAPKPQFDPQPQYGQYGGPSQYYGQQHQPQQHGGQSYQQAQPQQPGYPSQYGGYAGGQNTGGFPVQPPQGQQPSGPPTPPTGYPTYGQPQHSGSSAPSAGPAQQPPSQQSGPAPS